ncbi:sulfatase family protein [Rubripirellula reticaptiva]|uniref:Arylsulfatase n=1 Tax=Rubripirellula reticaptiva TaxID=2528013 RepID=A0A5C6F8P1_9BACT|nr:sulfatase [Rubripirellula reticaptiva]TWU56089.1 Arylsulfatase [Rubripirellula reticaptiva]
MNQLQRLRTFSNPVRGILFSAAACYLAAACNFEGTCWGDERPNIVWIIPDDMSANFACYGETAIATPNVDKLAANGVKFTNAYVTAPVCSTCRSAFITGMYQTSIGAHHHRSGRGTEKISLPEGIELVPKLFQDAGYHTSISDWPIGGKLGKTDYNFQWDQSVYDSNDWADRKDGQPFFAQLQTKGGKLRGSHAASWEKTASAAEKKLGSRTTDDRVVLPPYYPRHPDVVRDWAAYLDSVRLTDLMVGEVVARLEAEGVRENTLILFMTDHGISHARGKQFMYDEGLHVPLVISGPSIKPGTVRNDLVEHIDIAALSLAAAGIPVPTIMQARNILATDYQPRDAVFAARDRCDETVDHMRAVRTKELKYIRNFLPNRPHLQPCAYKDAKAILIALRQWHDAGKLDSVQELLFRPTRAAEELYDLSNDPFEINNLVSDPAYATRLSEMRGRLDQWMESTGDQGRTPESDAMFDSDMAVYLHTLKIRGTASQLKTVQNNIALMKKWAAEGK